MNTNTNTNTNNTNNVNVNDVLPVGVSYVDGVLTIDVTKANVRLTGGIMKRRTLKRSATDIEHTFDVSFTFDGAKLSNVMDDAWANMWIREQRVLRDLSNDELAKLSTSEHGHIRTYAETGKKLESESKNVERVKRAIANGGITAETLAALLAEMQARK